MHQCATRHLCLWRCPSQRAVQARDKHKPDFLQLEVYGNNILHATAFAIIISAPIGLLVIALLGPLMLEKVTQIPFISDLSASWDDKYAACTSQPLRSSSWHPMACWCLRSWVR